MYCKKYHYDIYFVFWDWEFSELRLTLLCKYFELKLTLLGKCFELRLILLCTKYFELKLILLGKCFELRLTLLCTKYFELKLILLFGICLVQALKTLKDINWYCLTLSIQLAEDSLSQAPILKVGTVHTAGRGLAESGPHTEGTPSHLSVASIPKLTKIHLTASHLLCEC